VYFNAISFVKKRQHPSTFPRELNVLALSTKKELRSLKVPALSTKFSCSVL
jgi:hypothetical protein